MFSGIYGDLKGIERAAALGTLASLTGTTANVATIRLDFFFGTLNQAF